MDKTIQNSLCRGLRASGIPKRIAHEIQNEVTKWVTESGEQWAVDRIKSLRLWYETCLAGDPKPPLWMKRSKDRYPLGIWKSVFSLPKSKALAVLSCGTVFYNKELTKPSKEKFLKGINGNGTKELGWRDFLNQLGVRGDVSPHIEFKKVMNSNLEPMWPTIFDMNGSVPIHDATSTMRPDGNISVALKALQESWKSCPEVTLNFISEVLDRPDVIPINVLGNEYRVWDNARKHTQVVGRVSRIPECELKDRWVANPNRILQVTLDPMKNLLMTLVKADPSNCIYNQDEGIDWVQAQLQKGYTLAGYDLSSASDLLNIRTSLNILENMFGLSKIDRWSDYRSYYLDICTSQWECPALGNKVTWDQGSPMGTGPSIGILGETNNACGYLAYYLAKQDRVIPSALRWDDCFRTIGDDFICRKEIGPYYERAIHLLGGEINHTKTITSNKVAEFAGRVVLPNCFFLKKIHYREPSDNSFMSYMSNLGDQAKYFLKPKQRLVYNLFKEVPGIIVAGPWNQDSFGLSIQDRYQWYLECVEPVLKRERPDVQVEDYGMTLLRATYGLLDPSKGGKDIQSITLDTGSRLMVQRTNDPEDGYYANNGLSIIRQIQYGGEERGWVPNWDLDLSYPVLEDYQSSKLSNEFRKSGDPRLINGQTLLDSLYRHVEAKDIMTFEEWKTINSPNLETSTEDDHELFTATDLEEFLNGTFDDEPSERDVRTPSYDDLER